MFINLQQMQCDVSKVSSNTNLSAELERIASDKGFVISDNEGSGNCMFFALSEQLNLVKGIKISHGELRQSIVHYLRRNPKLVSVVFYFIVHVPHMWLWKMCSTWSDSRNWTWNLIRRQKSMHCYTGIVWLQKIYIPPPRVVVWFVPPSLKNFQVHFILFL